MSLLIVLLVLPLLIDLVSSRSSEGVSRLDPRCQLPSLFLIQFYTALEVILAHTTALSVLYFTHEENVLNWENKYDRSMKDPFSS